MEGIGSLLQSALTLFPLESGPLLQLLTALAIASKDSAAKVRAPRGTPLRAPLHHIPTADSRFVFVYSITKVKRQ